MNELEKRSFYSFLGLYIVSSFLFLSLTAFWYYTAQKSALENETFYRLEHLADHTAGEIIFAHMQGKPLQKITVPDDIVLALVDTKGDVTEGKLVDPHIQLKPGYFRQGNYDVLVSDAPHEHLDIRYVVVQSDRLTKAIASLKQTVVTIAFVTALLITLIAWVLSMLFMRPVRQRVAQIERFINDITHELNTPISSLTMATDQAIKQEKCTVKTLKNISISTRQLYDIYRSLTYLNFSAKETEDEVIDLAEVLERSVEYYRPLAEVKQIAFDVSIESMTFMMPQSQATLLFGNLIGNAVKYSPRRSDIVISLKEGVLSVLDHGIGIDHKKHKEIFEKFQRGTDYSGGFGVGLSIVKSICDRYGIRVSLKSAFGEGTEFRLHFPKTGE